MRTKTILALLAIVLIIGVSFVANAQATKNLAGAYNRVVLDGDENYIKPNPVSSISIENTATTTLTVITAISGRDRLIVRVNASATEEVAWVNLGGVVATESYGIRIDYLTPLDIELSDDVTAAVISASAAPLAIIQTVRE